jgi:hypothetical protein
MSSPRRTFLVGLSAGLTSLAGCSSLRQQSQTRIGEIILLNMNDRSHTVRVQVQSSGNVLYDTSTKVPPSGEEQPVITRDDGLPSEPRHYTISATLDGGEDSIEKTYPTKGGNCYSVTARIGTDGKFRDMPSESEFDGCNE